MKISVEISAKLSKVSLLCALMVVALHVGIGPKWIDNALAIRSVAVPFFFVIAGYLFAGHLGDPGWYVRQVKSRVRSLLVPYVLWNVLYWCFVVGLSFAFGFIGVSYGGVDTLDGLMWKRWDVLGLNPLAFPAMGLLWFVRCLLVITIVSPIFVVLRKKWCGVLILIGYAVMVWFEATHPDPESGWVSIWLAKGWIRAAVYFSAGVWVRFHGGCELRVHRVVGGIVMAIGWLLLATTRIGSLSVPIAIFGLWYVLSGDAWPKFMTKCAFPIYVLHIFFATVAAAVISTLGLKDWASVSPVAWVLKWCVMAGGPMLAACMIRRFSGQMAELIFGGR